MACETNCRCNTDGEKLVETSKVVLFENCFLSTRSLFENFRVVAAVCDSFSQCTTLTTVLLWLRLMA